MQFARDGDRAARGAFVRAGRAIGVGIATLVSLVGPERVVVTGEGLDTCDLFGAHIKEACTSRCSRRPRHAR
ncbi:hypothetical protein OG618_06585 [Kitasatospora sp. NBC_01246]|uniref:hypothetical protein n=1 Tax=Kitasatospora sp. NBC_01246 TaxID=2903570 RepID=UPI002E33B9C6|nr:hypothetical protein [Kitasatospora sp. NBC_01246]